MWSQYLWNPISTYDQFTSTNLDFKKLFTFVFLYFWAIIYSQYTKYFSLVASSKYSVQEIKLTYLCAISNKKQLFNRINKTTRLKYDLHMKGMALLTFPDL